MSDRTFQMTLALCIIFGVGQVVTDKCLWVAIYFVVLSGVGTVWKAKAEGESNGRS